MYQAVWKRAAGYEGCDERYLPDERTCFVGDCRRIMRNIDLQRFSIFDCDAYGSPYEVMVIIAARRKVAPGELVGLAVTDGSGLKLRFGGLPHAMAKLSGIQPGQVGAFHDGEEIAIRAVKAMAARMNARIETLWKATRTGGASMLYMGVVMKGVQ